MSEEKTDWKKLEIGALWKKEGKKMLTGEINGKRVIIFPNKFKEEDGNPNAPDFRVYNSPDDGNGPNKSSDKKPETKAKPEAPAKKVDAAVEDDGDGIF